MEVDQESISAMQEQKQNRSSLDENSSQIEIANLENESVLLDPAMSVNDESTVGSTLPSYRTQTRQNGEKLGQDESVSSPVSRNASYGKTLMFQSLGMYGREEESARLNESLDRVMNTKGHRELVLISGTSGTGKTRLAHSTKELMLQKTTDGLVVQGKFDTSSNGKNNPFSGITEAASQICCKVHEMEMDDPDWFRTLCERLRHEIGPQLERLIKGIVPVLGDLLKQDGSPTVVEQDASPTPMNDTSQDQLYYAFARFLRIISAKFKPLILVLDDLHRASHSALKLVDVIMTVHENETPLLVVGTYRSDEIDDSNVVDEANELTLTRLITELKRKSVDDQDFQVEEIAITDLDYESVRQIVYALFDHHDPTDINDALRTTELVHRCLVNTHGNPFFLLHYMKILWVRQLLRFNQSRNVWEWEENEIFHQEWVRAMQEQEQTRSSTGENNSPIERVTMKNEKVFLDPTMRRNDESTVDSTITSYGIRTKQNGEDFLPDGAAATPSREQQESVSTRVSRKEPYGKQLQFSSLGMYGRDEESARLNESLDRVMNTKGHRELVLISGTSGTGKTRLAHSTKELMLQKTTDGLFVQGKFDTSSNGKNKPYSGITQAASKLCCKVHEMGMDDPEWFGAPCETLRSEIGNQLERLINGIVPVLGDLLEQDVSPTIVKQDASSTPMNDTSQHQLYYAFARFLRIISAKFKPLVFVLDDLHRASHSALELIDVIMTDHENETPLLVVGTYRSDEIDDSNVVDEADELTLSRLITELKRKSVDDQDFQVEEIAITDLDYESVRQIVKTLLDLNEPSMDNTDASRISELAHLCLVKTHGNAFFLLNFMKILWLRQLLQYNQSRKVWEWEESDINQGTSMTDNMVHLLNARLVELSQESYLTNILQLACCFGSTFSVSTMKLVWTNLHGLPPDQRSEVVLEEGLNALENNDLIVLTRNANDLSDRPMYVWSHDKIQDEALRLFPDESDRIAFGSEVAEIIFRRLDQLEKSERDSAMLLAVKLLNDDCSNMVNEIGWLTLAERNYEACVKAISMSHFHAAADYAEKGIALLPQSSWTTHPDLTLKLYSIGAKAQNIIGNVRKMERYFIEVMNRAGVNVEDTFIVRYAYADSFMTRGEIKQAIAILTDTLSLCNCRFPSMTIAIYLGIIWKIFRIRMTRNPVEMSSLSAMTDTKRIEMMKFLDKLATCLYMNHEPLLPLIVFRSLDYTLKYGYCDYSPVTFAAMAIVLTGVVGDFKRGCEFGERALALMRKMKGEETKARTLFLVNALVFPWTKKAEALLAPLTEAYEIGLKTG